MGGGKHDDCHENRTHSQYPADHIFRHLHLGPAVCVAIYPWGRRQHPAGALESGASVFRIAILLDQW